MAMDTIFIRGLKIAAVIGVYDWEQKGPQTLLFDIDIRTTTTEAAKHDCLEATINYAEVAHILHNTFLHYRCALIETAAETAATVLLKHFSLSWIRITLKKAGALPEADTVGIMIERARQC